MNFGRVCLVFAGAFIVLGLLAFFNLTPESPGNLDLLALVTGMVSISFYMIESHAEQTRNRLDAIEERLDE